MTGVEVPEIVSTIASFLTSGVVMAGIYVGYRFVMPKLAKKQWMDKNIASLSDNYEFMYKNTEEMKKLYTMFRGEFMKIKKSLQIMATYSNLGDSPKTMIQALLEDAGVDMDQFDDLTEETKEFVKDSIEKVNKHMAEQTKSALEELAEEVEEG